MQFQELPPLERVILVVGSEGHGVRTITLRECDFVVRLTTYGRVESLNAAVAAGIGLYALASHLRRAPPEGSA